MSSLHQTYRICNHVRFRIVWDEAVVIDQKKAMVYVLNPVGAFVLAQLKGRSSLAELIEATLGEFDVGHELATQDVLLFIDRLEASELIEKSAASSEAAA